MNQTVFTGVNLCVVKGLNTMIHDGPSTVNINTVQLPVGETFIHFLRGSGFPDIIIDYLPSLLTSAIQYASCFIGYAHQDEPLARRLYNDLQEKGVRCWFAPHDLRPGTRYHRGIEDAIHFQEKLLLLLSEYAIQSGWVETEVLAALDKEKNQHCEMLFPVRLDETVMHTSQAWAAQLRRSRHIGDFTAWLLRGRMRQSINSALPNCYATSK